jgi:hypothetical protein
MWPPASRDRPAADIYRPPTRRKKKRARLPASLSLFDPICTATVPEPAFPYGMAAVLAILSCSGECFKALNSRRARKRVGWLISTGPRGRGSASGGAPHDRPIPANEPTCPAKAGIGRVPGLPARLPARVSRHRVSAAGPAEHPSHAGRSRLGTGFSSPSDGCEPTRPGGKPPPAASDSETRTDNPGKRVRKIASA